MKPGARSRDHKPKTPQALEQRKQQVLTRKTPSAVDSIANALVVKDGDLCFLTEYDGDVPMRAQHGFGLYYQDMRYMNGYTLRLDGQEARALVSANRGGFKAVIQLANPDLRLKGGDTLDASTVGITWSRMLKSDHRSLYDVIAVENYSQEPVCLPLNLAFRADFEDVFAVRGLLNERPGRLHKPRWDTPQMLYFQYDGADDVVRRLSVYFSARPVETGEASARFSISLGPGERYELMVGIEVSVTAAGEEAEPHRASFPDLDQVETWLHKSSDAWMKGQPAIHSNSLLLNRILDRSLRDMHTLHSSLDHETYIAAGVPWFATLFGRDSLISALQMLAYEPTIAEGTLRLLAKYQGRAVDEWRDEQPGKILHELREGELANLRAIPHDPYYGTVDATPLFLILMARHAHWAGRLQVFHDLRDNVERALTWIQQYADADGDGYIDYTSGNTGGGLVNQGWKDTGDAIVNRDGSLATPPIALVEAQAYVYMAKVEIADLFERVGEAERARTLRQEAEALRERFNRDYWMEHERFYALAIQKGGKLSTVITSNPGHALWAGIVDPDKAHQVERRLMAPDMWSGWGVRTLSCEEKRYNPNSYHLGSVWPHDNGIIAAGLRRYGYDSSARRVFRGIFEAATHFDQYRMPELFTGFPRDDFGEPVRYQVACHPQAWAAGSLPFMMTVLLGLIPDAFNGRLRVVRPLLPDFVNFLELHRVRLGAGHVSLRFEREGEHVKVEVLRAHDVEVTVEET